MVDLSQVPQTNASLYEYLFCYYFPPLGGYIFTSACFFVCLSVCRQDISKSIAPIFMKVC